MNFYILSFLFLSIYFSRLPNVTVPNAQYIPALIQDAFVVGIVTYSVTVSLAKVFAREFGYSIDTNQV